MSSDEDDNDLPEVLDEGKETIRERIMKSDLYESIRERVVKSDLYKESVKPFVNPQWDGDRLRSRDEITEIEEKELMEKVDILRSNSLFTLQFIADQSLSYGIDKIEKENKDIHINQDIYFIGNKVLVTIINEPRTYYRHVNRIAGGSFRSG